MSKKAMFSKPVERKTLAEQMAETVQEFILSGELQVGAALPTEPELAQQFGVSRAVVRDATRILMAQGLVEVQHGRGVFVTPAQNEAFGEALLLALRRAGATVWDVEQFEQAVFPEVAALAASAATDEDIAAMQQALRDYSAVFAEHQAAPPAELERLRSAYQALMQRVFAATHNQVFQQLARPLLNLRSLRQWASDESETPETATERETRHLRQVLDAIAARDSQQAREMVKRLVQLPSQAIQAMRQTPVGEVPVIPVPLSQLDD
jgi:GntR family transcriptional repressor for pyruvate dehydrogenase complex